MSSAQFIVAKGLQELVSHNIPQSGSRVFLSKNEDEKEKQIQKYVQYFLRVLSARIQSDQANTSSDHIKELISKKIEL